jgi:hypothetical protein
MDLVKKGIIKDKDNKTIAFDIFQIAYRELEESQKEDTNLYIESFLGHFYPVIREAP